VNGNFSFVGTAKMNVDITDSGFDKLVVAGALSTIALGSKTTLILPTAFTPAIAQSYTLIDNQTPNAMTGAFANYAEGAAVMLGTRSYTLSYIGGDGNDLVLKAPGVPGDYNNNGVVDAADYVLWRKGGPLANEVPPFDDNITNQDDYNAWRANFGNGGSGSGSLSGAGSVPEPASVALLTFAASVILAFRRKR
jgi:hypothetical protein